MFFLQRRSFNLINDNRRKREFKEEYDLTYKEIYDNQRYIKDILNYNI